MKIVLGVTGGIAAYKAVSLLRLLSEAGHEVRVVPTQNALRFVGAATFEALSGFSVSSELYEDVAQVKHIELAKWADLVIVAPATASFLARYASGIADDLLGNILLATSAPVLVAPAMHTEMWNHPATVENVRQLRERDVSVIEPASGRLTGEDSGAGRLPEPEEIFESVNSALTFKSLSGKVILVTSGGTREDIDPVRFIANNSSGIQGAEIALEAQRRGAEVILIAANQERPSQFSGEFISVKSALEMHAALHSRLSSLDALVMTAAVSDYRVSSVSEQKIKRETAGSDLTLSLVANPDILKEAIALRAAKQLRFLAVGFAAETESDSEKLAALAATKRLSKGCEIIVANDVSGGAVFGQSTNSVIISSDRYDTRAVAGSKKEIAVALLDIIQERIQNRETK